MLVHYNDVRIEGLIRRLQYLDEVIRGHLKLGDEPFPVFVNEAKQVIAKLNSLGVPGTDPRELIERFRWPEPEPEPPPKPRVKRKKKPTPAIVEVVPEPVEPVREKTEIERHLEAI